nr:MAG TPA: hypothetical protein [Caudoviricetes sp.]
MLYFSQYLESPNTKYLYIVFFMLTYEHLFSII